MHALMLSVLINTAMFNKHQTRGIGGRGNRQKGVAFSHQHIRNGSDIQTDSRLTNSRVVQVRRDSPPGVRPYNTCRHTRRHYRDVIADNGHTPKQTITHSHTEH